VKTHSVSCYIMLPPVRNAPNVGLKRQEPVGFCVGRGYAKERF